jgi:hypothetical protein
MHACKQQLAKCHAAQLSIMAQNLHNLLQQAFTQSMHAS